MKPDRFFYPQITGKELVASVRARRSGYQDKVLSLFSRLCGYKFNFLCNKLELDIEAWDERFILSAKDRHDISLLSDILYSMEKYGVTPARSTANQLWYDFDSLAKLEV